MHNFGVPSVLKLWIDQIARVGRTFSYADGKPKGLIVGKKATFIIATGGIYDAQTQMASFNFVEPYLRSVFGFLGVTDATFLTAGGTACAQPGAGPERVSCAASSGCADAGADHPEENTHENCFDCCSLPAGADVCRLWAKWISQLHPPAATDESTGASVSYCRQPSHFAAFFFAVQVLGGLLLLSGFFVPLALTLLAAVLYNILAFHLTLSPASIAPALVACVLWVLVFLQYRESFNGIFSAKPATQS